MLQILVRAATVGILSIGLNYAHGTPDKVVIPVHNVSPTDGKQMFTSYCAPCHGMDGRGGGPMAVNLQEVPADLTEFARGNLGRFPESHVASVLQIGVPKTRYHSSQMPVWGPVFAGMTHLSPNDEYLRILNIVRYLESIQGR